MDILNRLFLLPNNNIILILSFIFTFLEIYLTMLLFTLTLNISSTKNQKILYVLSLSLLAIISKLFIPIPYNIFFNLLLSPTLIFFIFKTTLFKSILSEIVPFFIFGVIGSLLINILEIFIPNISKYIINIPIYKLSYSISLYLIIYILCILIKNYKFKLKIAEKFKNSFFNNIIIYMNLIIGILAIFLESYILSKYSNNLPIIFSFSSIFVLLIYFILSIYSLIRTSKLEILNQTLEQSKAYNKTLKILYDNISLFKHDFNNIIQSLGGYIEAQDISGLKKYYLEIFDDCQKNNNLTLLNPEIVNNPAIYNLICSKYYQADSLKIKFNLNILLDLNKINIKIYDLTKILGILLDNSIEAANKCKKKFIDIDIYESYKNSKIIIIIKNSCASTNININQIFKKHYSTKKSKENGLGLWEINKIIRKYNNLKLYTSFENNIFEQKLEIYN